MKKPVQSALTGALMLSTAFASLAVPAKPGTLTMTQADGSQIEVSLIGDERSHQYFTPDGYLLKEEAGNFYYATVDAAGRPVSTGIQVRTERTAEVHNFLAGVDRAEVRAALDRALEATPQHSQRRGAGLFPETRFPAFGEQKAIVILVEYTDVKMSVENPHEYFSNMLNQPGFSEYGGTGSARDFFVESSMGQFVPEFDLYGPITLDHNMAYYGGNSWGGDDQAPEQMVVEACRILDDEIDFSEYDRDGDGYVDNIFIFYAGRGEASGGGANTVWPHSWTVSSGQGYSPMHDGVYIDRYACSNEWEGSRPDGVGTFVHEFSHVMGLPDLYATSYTGAFTPGSWSCLDYGPYNNDGCTPPIYGAFERYALGWMEPVVIDGPMNAVLPAITTNVAGIVMDDENEFFLFENRQQTGWDAYIPGHGMLVWHVDYDDYVWQRNAVNNTSSHQYVDIEEADGTQSEYSRAGDAFPGSENITSFTDDTRPSMRTWGGRRFELPLTEIKETDGIITFLVAGGAPDLDAPAIAFDDVTFDSFTITWDPEAIEGAELMADIYIASDALSTDRQYLEGYQNRSLGKSGSHTVTGVEPQTTYYVEVYSRRGLQASGKSEPQEVFTGRPSLDRQQAVALEAVNIGETSFTATWEAMEDATGYFLSVYEHIYGAPYRDECGFDDGVDQLPEGWVSTSPASYANTAYSGAAIPALRLGQTGESITTPRVSDEVHGFSFWHRGSSTSETDRLRVSVLIGSDAAESWNILADKEIVNDKGGATYTFDEIPEGTRAVRVEYIRTTIKGAVAIDDIVFLHGTTFSDEVLPAFDALPVGNVTEYTVEGLRPAAVYTFAVAGTDGELTSLLSEKVVFETKESSSVAQLATGAISFTVSGRILTVSGAAAGDIITVSDLAGRIAARSAAADGTASLTLPAPGVYIAACGAKVAKIIVR